MESWVAGVRARDTAKNAAEALSHTKNSISDLIYHNSADNDVFFLLARFVMKVKAAEAKKDFQGKIDKIMKAHKLIRCFRGMTRPDTLWIFFTDSETSKLWRKNTAEEEKDENEYEQKREELALPTLNLFLQKKKKWTKKETLRNVVDENTKLNSYTRSAHSSRLIKKYTQNV